MNKKQGSALSVEQQQQQSANRLSRDIAVAPPSGAVLAIHGSKKKKDGVST